MQQLFFLWGEATTATLLILNNYYIVQKFAHNAARRFIDAVTRIFWIATYKQEKSCSGIPTSHVKKGREYTRRMSIVPFMYGSRVGIGTCVRRRSPALRTGRSKLVLMWPRSNRVSKGRLVHRPLHVRMGKRCWCSKYCFNYRWRVSLVSSKVSTKWIEKG
jgi:hypothetical protein